MLLKRTQSLKKKGFHHAVIISEKEHLDKIARCMNEKGLNPSYNIPIYSFSDGKEIERIDSVDDKFSYQNARLEDLKIWREYWDLRADKNEIPILFYEGYRAVDSEGNEVDIEHSERHLIRLAYAEERGKKISFNYEGLIEFKFAIIVSICTCGILMVLWRNSFE